MDLFWRFPESGYQEHDVRSLKVLASNLKPAIVKFYEKIRDVLDQILLMSSLRNSVKSCHGPLARSGDPRYGS